MLSGHLVTFGPKLGLAEELPQSGPRTVLPTQLGDERDNGLVFPPEGLGEPVAAYRQIAVYRDGAKLLQVMHAPPHAPAGDVHGPGEAGERAGKLAVYPGVSEAVEHVGGLVLAILAEPAVVQPRPLTPGVHLPVLHHEIVEAVPRAQVIVQALVRPVVGRRGHVRGYSATGQVHEAQPSLLDYLRLRVPVGIRDHDYLLPPELALDELRQLFRKPQRDAGDGEHRLGSTLSQNRGEGGVGLQAAFEYEINELGVVEERSGQRVHVEPAGQVGRVVLIRPFVRVRLRYVHTAMMLLDVPSAPLFGLHNI